MPTRFLRTRNKPKTLGDWAFVGTLGFVEAIGKEIANQLDAETAKVLEKEREKGAELESKTKNVKGRVIDAEYTMVHDEHDQQRDSG